MQENVILSKKIYSYIIDEIVSGRLRMGQIIDENKIKDVFNVSKTPIREAIISLENEEVVKKNGKSYFVSFIEPEEIDQIFEARRELESIAAFLAAQRMQRQELKQMENIITKLKDVNGETDPIELANLNGKFHSLIAKASGNKYIESCVNSMRLKLRIVRVTLFTSIERREDEYKEHFGIFEAIKNKDADKARSLMFNHETDVWEYTKKYIIPKLYY